MELQGLAARSAVITVQSICQELDAAVAVARERGQAQAMVSASALRVKLAGLGVEKVEVSVNDQFEAVRSLEDVADILARDEDVTLSPEERTAFPKILVQFLEAGREFFAGCKAKVVQPVMTAQQWEYVVRKRLGLLRPNGDQRR